MKEIERNRTIYGILTGVSLIMILFIVLLMGLI
jgi:hypothetical protein